MFDQLQDLAMMQGELLRDHRCGHPQWYAENLVAVVTRSKVMPTNFKDYDLESPDYGRIQVKSRVDGTDTSYNQNRTNFGKYELDVFDWAVVIIFTCDFRIDGAVLLKHRT